MVWLSFGIVALAILMAGPVLARSADQIALHFGISSSWIGLVLLATATSLPELVTGISAVTGADAPNLAVGNALGGCILNLALLALLDLLVRPEPLYGRADQTHILTAALGIMMIGVVGMVLVVGRDVLDIRLWHVSIYSPALILLYAIAMRASFLRERRSVAMSPADDRGSLRPAALAYASAALVIVIAGSALPYVGVAIAELMGWRTSFVGTLAAGATSLPELVVMVAALRRGSVDLAMAGILGSNLFNMVILALDDIAYTKGSLFAAASPAHAGSAFAAVIMSGIVIAAILDRPKVRLFGTVGWISLALIALYIASAYSIYLLGH